MIQWHRRGAGSKYNEDIMRIRPQVSLLSLIIIITFFYYLLSV